jgi:hypothetical protein
MKFVFLSGGLAGFLLVAVTGFHAGRAPDRVFFDAALGCLAGAVLFRWFWSVLLHGFREAYLTRQRNATPAADAGAKTKTSHVSHTKQPVL